MPKATQPSTNGAKPTYREPSSQEYMLLLQPMGRKLVWAIGTTFYDQFGYRLPNKQLIGLADQIAIDTLASLEAMVHATTPWAYQNHTNKP